MTHSRLQPWQWCPPRRPIPPWRTRPGDHGQASLAPYRADNLPTNTFLKRPLMSQLTYTPGHQLDDDLASDDGALDDLGDATTEDIDTEPAWLNHLVEQWQTLHRDDLTVRHQT